LQRAIVEAAAMVIRTAGLIDAALLICVPRLRVVV
jgi:hypothetical protein